MSSVLSGCTYGWHVASMCWECGNSTGNSEFVLGADMSCTQHSGSSNDAQRERHAKIMVGSTESEKVRGGSYATFLVLCGPACAPRALREGRAAPSTGDSSLPDKSCGCAQGAHRKVRAFVGQPSSRLSAHQQRPQRLATCSSSTCIPTTSVRGTPAAATEARPDCLARVSRSRTRARTRFNACGCSRAQGAGRTHQTRATGGAFACEEKTLWVKVAQRMARRLQQIPFRRFVADPLSQGECNYPSRHVTIALSLVTTLRVLAPRDGAIASEK